MSIQPMSGASPRTQSQAAKQAMPFGASFQDLLSATAKTAAVPPAGGDSFDARLAELDALMLERMRSGKEKAQEQKEWEHILACLDAWIETLREEGDIGKVVRAHAKVLEDEANQICPKKTPQDYLMEIMERSV